MQILLILYHLVAGALTRAPGAGAFETALAWLGRYPKAGLIAAALLGFCSACLLDCAP